MVTIVRYKHSNELYIYLGTGFGMFQSSRPGSLLGGLSPKEKEGDFSKAAVCDADGSIYWGLTDQMTVETIDGELPSVILGRVRASDGQP